MPEDNPRRNLSVKAGKFSTQLKAGGLDFNTILKEFVDELLADLDAHDLQLVILTDRIDAAEQRITILEGGG